MLLWVLVCTALDLAFGENPIVSNVGLADPHVHHFQNYFYVYATHDYSSNNTGFRMDNWWVWSSPDLVKWSLESVLLPQNTPAPPAAYHTCWATDAAQRDKDFYFYLSIGSNQVAVVSGTSPTGPWKDPLHVPLLSAALGRMLDPPTTIRDPGVLQDDDGSYYIVFGTFVYYIAKLGNDMISLAETPKHVIINNALGPYGPGKTDDKPFLHKFNGRYYLSWGCFYSTGSSPYGPFQYQGSVLNRLFIAPDFRMPVDSKLPWYAQEDYADRHGSFWSANGQNYYASNDRSHSTDPHPMYFRDTVIGYVHYFANGTIAPVRIDRTGVGEYESSRVEAENYFSIENAYQGHTEEGEFGVYGINSETILIYPRVRGVPVNPWIKFYVSNGNEGTASIEVREGSIKGRLLGRVTVESTKHWENFQEFECMLDYVPVDAKKSVDIVLSFSGRNSEVVRLDAFSIYQKEI